MKRILFLITSILILMSPSSSPAKQFKALVFADAFDKWHFGNVPVARESFEMLARKHFLDLTWVETDAAFGRKTFSDFDVIVFISANPCELDEEKRQEFMEYIHAGGGIVGVHGASATLEEPNRWPWWEELLGRVFLHHPPQQTGTLQNLDPNFPACMHLPKQWLWTDEWYEFEIPFPDHLNVVLTVDEASYKACDKHPMGDFHPIAWYHEFQGARVFYTAIGHIRESYRDDAFLQHIYGGMLWAVGERNPKW